MVKMVKGARVLETRQDYNEFFFNKPYFAFLDILGFKSLVKYNADSTLYSLYEELIIEPVKKFGKYFQEQAKKKVEEQGERYEDSGLRIVNISDSILLWTAHGQQSALMELLQAIDLLLSTSMLLGAPLRGTITMQPFNVMDGNGALSIVGRGLVYAYELEGMQNWSGCVVDNGVINFLRSFEKVVMNREIPSMPERYGTVVKYEIPYKGGAKSGYAVNWCLGVPFDESSIAPAFEKYNKRKDESEALKAATDLKIQNTIDFFKYCRQLYAKK